MYNLARARGRVVLAQIEFTRVSHDFAMFNVTVIFLHSTVRYMTSLQLDSGLYIAVHYTGHRGHVLI